MQVKIYPEKANTAAVELLELSRTIRRCREEVETVQGQLRQLTELEECRAALRRQDEALALVTARLVNMSSALREITGAYNAAEDRNLSRLEEAPRPSREPGSVVLYGTGAVSSRIHKILHK